MEYSAHRHSRTHFKCHSRTCSENPCETALNPSLSACPDNLDPRVEPEDDNRRRMCFTPEYDEKKEADITTFENDHKRRLIKGLKCIEIAESGVDSAQNKKRENFSVHRST